jgi:hypothetical protein
MYGATLFQPEYKLAQGSGTSSNKKHQWGELYFGSLVVHFEELRKKAKAGPITRGRRSDRSPRFLLAQSYNIL